MFGDFPDTWTILGAAVIVASSLFAWYRDKPVIPTAAKRSGGTSSSSST